MLTTELAHVFQLEFEKGSIRVFVRECNQDGITLVGEANIYPQFFMDGHEIQITKKLPWDCDLMEEKNRMFAEVESAANIGKIRNDRIGK
jgi:hypothetical protein